MVGWRRRSACLWIVCRVFVAFSLLWVGQRFARAIDGRKSRAIEECGYAVAPLVLFALLWLFDDLPQSDDLPQRSKRWAAPA
jgi:hypothetical protein